MKLREKQTLMTRGIIKQTALGLFCAGGIELTDMSQIAEQAGVSRRTLYHHFKDKEELAAEIYLENLQKMFGQLVPDFDYRQPVSSILSILDKYLLLKQQSEALLYYDAIFNVYYSTLAKNPADLPDYGSMMAQGYERLMRLEADGMSAEEQAQWREKLFMSTHLWFSYLQKSVVAAHQRGGEVTEADVAEDLRYKEFIIKAVGKGRC
ncbi:TetR/AcrR family transcriptional regulator [Paenibacillus donghaensis]|uniref:HTH tetR-type domain-containing protein n=1 Tax=Paenibacillus donghaensis TaxID=414771 RepID=A0A2Z2KAA4_9BACL|nr:TetR/AcrR family transcriptional regulator [Paenibacillus donghaensis]ASA22504.1 hypothetical protein B9T62_17975 [Paenibacillus donghaensis]